MSCRIALKTSADSVSDQKSVPIDSLLACSHQKPRLWPSVNKWPEHLL